MSGIVIFPNGSTLKFNSAEELAAEYRMEGQYEEFYAPKPLYHYNRLQHGNNPEMAAYHKRRRLAIGKKCRELNEARLATRVLIV